MATNGWDKWGDRYQEQLAPVMDWLVRAAAIGPGMTVLDIACGTGQPAIPAARRVGPTGKVIATDIDPNMRAATERRAREAGVTNLDVRDMNMHELHVADASVDAVTLGFVLMFSPDPVKVMTEVRRVLVPGGRCALAVWAEPTTNPFFTTVFGAMAEVTAQPPPPANAPGPFRLAPPGELAGVLATAGFAEVVVEPLPLTYESASLDAHHEMLYDMALKSKIDALSPADAARFRGLFDAALAGYVGADGRVRVGFTPLCASGRT